MVAEPVHLPYAFHVEVRQLGLGDVELIAQHGQADQRVCLQLVRYMVSVLIEHDLARGKAADKTNLHWALGTLTLEQRDASHRTVRGTLAHSGVIHEGLLLQTNGYTH